MARLPRSSRARKENAMRRLRVIVVESRDGLVREQLPGRRGTGRKGGAMRRLSFIGVCLTPVLLLLGAAGTPAAASTSAPVTIQDTVIIGPFTGTWSASGGISDSGTLTEPTNFRVGVGAGGVGQVHLVRVMTGSLGTITLVEDVSLTLEPDGSIQSTGQWAVTGGTGAYAQLHGQGTSSAVVVKGVVTETDTGSVHFD
jgi:hypothetical protein